MSSHMLTFRDITNIMLWTRSKMTTTKTYKHRRLSNSQIRILHLQHGDSIEELQCRIEHVDFDAAKYVALSYPWGGDKEEYWLRVRSATGNEEGDIPLTQNLHNALRDLVRSPVQPKCFWIDQICIDQTNMQDKETQVKRMGEIYRRAISVVTYAGPEASGDVTAIALLEQLTSHYIKPFYKEFMEDRVWIWLMTIETRPKYDEDRRSDTNSLEIDIQRRLETALPSHEGWGEMMRMLLGSWGGANILILCGFLRFKLLGRRLPDGQTLSDEHALYLYNVSMLWRIRRLVLRGKTLNLSDLLHWFRNSLCSDPRDTVYALLSLAQDRDVLGIEPDYSKSFSDVLVDTTAAILKNYGLSMYTKQREAVDMTPRPAVPSWVPMWAPGSLATHLVHTPPSTRMEPENLSESVLRFDDKNKTLIIKAVYIGRISRLFGLVTERPAKHVRHLLSGGASQGIHPAGLAFKNAASFLLEHGMADDDITHMLGRAFVATAPWVDHKQHAAAPLALNTSNIASCLQCAAQIRAGYRAAMKILVHGGSHSSGSDYGELLNTSNNNSPGSTEDMNLGMSFIHHFGVHRGQLALVGDNDVAWLPLKSQPGDFVLKPIGLTTTLVLRAVTVSCQEYEMIGTAYVHGYIDGDAAKLGQNWEDSAREIRIV
ncbi:heterokaryon incompatibility protein-domain-containing protein [Microdochium trichocladiopsis]|uniref:Heterokaryon incompatibility protein-domain-containing protein n=1 Tax=Microdochium trichocladiopsis TaxID=1682393 RepID=A0A9P9BRK1_9PEZI|nr:heterokaryon incompatibility protein-domain-containing protein [Microdochium trichocladiopsis]KAH7027355.1 heterokaryon incompatibility protein-domain-containing protein [Microdochium trichocladiopsis]